MLIWQFNLKSIRKIIKKRTKSFIKNRKKYITAIYRKIIINKSKRDWKIIQKFLNVALIFEGIVLISTFLAFQIYQNPFKNTDKIKSTHVLAIQAKRPLSVTPTVVQLSPTTYNSNVLQIAQAQAKDAKEINDFCLDVPVLMYHHVEPINEAQNEGHAQLTVDSGVFESQMSYLSSSGYNSILAEELIQALKSHRTLQPKSVVLTFDDGYDDNFIYAFEILKKYNMAGNFAIATGLVENKGYMSWSQIKELDNHLKMDLSNHTWSHSPLGSLERDKAEYEIKTAEENIKAHLGGNSSIFYYPYGSYNEMVISLLKEQGFRGAFSTNQGWTQCESEIFALKRLRIGNSPLSYYGL